MKSIHRAASRICQPLIALSLLCGAAPAAAPEFDARKLSALPEAIRPFIEKNEITGAVTAAGTADKVVHIEAIGKADLDKDQPMKKDAIFWIASMSKPITATAVLMLQDEDKLSVDDPVGKYIPELKELKTTEGKPVIVTLRHMLTHTSGMGEATNEEARAAKTLADIIPAYASKPVGFEPGARWQYCQSGINSLARVVEVVSGKSFPDFLQERLFTPLGMKDTTFYLTPDQLPRLATSYRMSEGKLSPAEIFLLQGMAPTSRDRFPHGNGGLFSTAGDYLTFCRMLLNGGSLDGKTYLKPQTVKLMRTISTADLKTGFTEGNGWGLGVCVVRQPQGVTESLSAGSFGHGGAYGTQAWIDPEKGFACVLMVQRANFPNSDNSEVRRAFQKAVVEAIK